MRRAATPGRAIVLKVGSSSLARPGGGLDPDAVRRVAAEVDSLLERGHPTVLVTSGAVAAGLPAMGLTERPTELADLQVAAAVGQGRLMERYTAEFDARGRVAGQVLLTRDVLAHREQYLNAGRTLTRMLEAGMVPIVNENDTVVVDELRLGDNDRLAAIVSHLVGAAMLVILTDTHGLYAADPRLSETAELITAVSHTDAILDELLASTGRSRAFGSGGVATKISAARMAAWSGVPTVIAAAGEAGMALAAVTGADVGTWVEPREGRLTARKLWIAFGLPSSGRLTLDDGARTALVSRGGSLLAVGISRVEGDFRSGDAVEVLDGAGALVGKGVTRHGAAELRAGSTPSGPVIHRDDLVVLA